MEILYLEMDVLQLANLKQDINVLETLLCIQKKFAHQFVVTVDEYHLRDAIMAELMGLGALQIVQVLH